MSYKKSKVGRLEKVSLRLSFGLIFSFLLLLFLAVAGYWVGYKVVGGELSKVDRHFLRLLARAYDHEIFLLRVIKASGADDYKATDSNRGYKFHETLLNTTRIYQSSAPQFSTQISVVLPDSLNFSVVEHQLALARGLANVYGDFWSGSSFTAPQMFLFDLNRHINIAFPSIELRSPLADSQAYGLLQVLEKVKHSIDTHPPTDSDLIVRWAPSGQYLKPGRQELLAYISDRASDDYQAGEHAPDELVAATLLELDEFNRFGVRIDKHFFDLPEFESIDLVAPDGTLLLGAPNSDVRDYENGDYFKSSGLFVKRSAGSRGTWQALYRISYERLLQEAFWPLLSMVALFFSSMLGGWWLINWYRRRILVPASSDYRELLVNHDFNHSILQTVPLALCVIREEGLHPVTQNSLYSDWFKQHDNLQDLMADWPMFERGKPIAGEGCLMIDARSLYARYAPTEYQGERVLLCTFTDITSHREAAATLVMARNAADAANAQKSHFVATISHEIRTPLYGVLGTLELLGLTPLSDRQRSYLSTIDSSSEVLLHLISDVLDISKIEAGQLMLEPIRFNPLDLLEDILRGYSAMAANKGLALYSCIDPHVPELVLGDSFRIRQIISNLLSNAIKFTHGGHVAVHLSALEHSPGKLDLRWRVVDTGPGMTPAFQTRLFEPFSQADNRHHTTTGAGLGLSISDHLCRIMGAALTVSSQVGEGTEFVFELRVEALEQPVRSLSTTVLIGTTVQVRTPYPALTDSLRAWIELYGARCDEAGGEPAQVLLNVMPERLAAVARDGISVFAQHDYNGAPQVIGKDILVNQHSLSGMLRALTMAVTGDLQVSDPHRVQPEKHFLGLNVLLAEDSAINRHLMQEQLQTIGCTVQAVCNGSEALQCLDLHTYDLILTDVNMPVMDGYVFARNVRLRNLDTPIIGVTANALREEGEHCIRAGMNNWLTKPIDIQGLYLCLKDAMDQPQAGLARELVAMHPAVDGIDVPERMLELFMHTIGEDLTALKAAHMALDPGETVRLLHRIRGALAVGRAKSLIVLCRDVETAVSSGSSLTGLSLFIERVERAVSAIKN